MTCVHLGNGTILNMGGSDRIIRDSSGRLWRFEDHSYMGPMICGRRGNILAAQPSSRSPFWTAYYAWRDQGKRLNGAECVWDVPPPEPEPLHIVGGMYVDPSSAAGMKKHLPAGVEPHPIGGCDGCGRRQPKAKP